MWKQKIFFIAVLFSAHIFGGQADIYINHESKIFHLYERINSGEASNSEIESAISSLDKEWEDSFSGFDKKLPREHCAFWIAADHLRVFVAMNNPEYMHSSLREIFSKWKNDSWTDEELSMCKAFEPDFIAVSIVQLLASPEKFQGKLVTVKGVLASHFEGSNLFLSRDSYNFVDIASSIQISGEGITEALDGKSLWVAGRFFTRNCVSSNVNTGCLKVVNVIRQDIDNYRKSIGTTKGN